jgi:hypothetical protein
MIVTSKHMIEFHSGRMRKIEKKQAIKETKINDTHKLAFLRSTDKSYKHNSIRTLIHRNCHQLPKAHMGLYALSGVPNVPCLP